MTASAVALGEYARDSLEILRRSLELCRQGQRPFYRVAAVQLRLLLCDSTHRHNQLIDISLLPQLLPTLELPAPEPDGQLLPLKEWLAWPLPGLALTVRELIRRVCDQDGGAHVDFRPVAGLEGLDPAGWIVELGEIVVNNVHL